MTNNNKSVGTHDIHPGVPEKLSYEIAEILTMVCNLLPKSVSVPKECKLTM